MARFLFLTQYFPPEIGAAPVRLDEITGALCSMGHAVDVVTAMPNYPAGRILQAYRGKLLVREERGKRHVIRTWIYATGKTGAAHRLAAYLSFTVSSLLGCFLARCPDYVFVESPPMFLGLTAWLYCHLTGARYIVNVSDPWLEFARDMGFVRSKRLFALLERLERFIYRHAERVNAVTETIGALLLDRKGVPCRKLAWLPNGANLGRFRVLAPDTEWRDRLGLDGQAVFVYAGSHQPSHALDVVLDAAALLDGSIATVLVGDGTDKERLMRSAAARGLVNVHFVAPQPVEEVPRILSLARGALVSIRGEEAFQSSRPAKLITALACGKPIVYCGRGEGASIVERQDCGLVVAPGDAVGLAAAMRKLADDEQLAVRLGRNARRVAEATADWEAIVLRWLSDLGLEAVQPQE